jgi:hypothetical protein
VYFPAALDSKDFPAIVSHAYSSNPEAMLCWLFGDEILAKIEADIDRHSPPASECVGTAERKELAVELAASLLAQERIEEALLDSTDTPRRRDADPRAVLGIA